MTRIGFWYRLTALLCCLLYGGLSPAWAGLAVPPVFNYQGLLTDGGGNPLPSGPTSLLFRITNDAQEVLFEEEQTVDVAGGIVSALIGNGTDPASGAVSGGLPQQLLTPDGTRYLEVWHDGALVDDPLEIVSVPYAYWCDEALGVAPGVIEMTHLSSTLITDLSTSITTNESFQTALSEPETASVIGVTDTFDNSSGQTIQDVLQDFDTTLESLVSKSGDTMTGDLTVQGNIGVTGTVDGVDVSSFAATAATQAYVDSSAAGTLGKIHVDSGVVTPPRYTGQNTTPEYTYINTPGGVSLDKCEWTYGFAGTDLINGTAHSDMDRIDLHDDADLLNNRVGFACRQCAYENCFQGGNEKDTLQCNVSYMLICIDK